MSHFVSFRLLTAAMALSAPSQKRHEKGLMAFMVKTPCVCSGIWVLKGFLRKGLRVSMQSQRQKMSHSRDIHPSHHARIVPPWLSALPFSCIAFLDGPHTFLLPQPHDIVACLAAAEDLVPLLQRPLQIFLKPGLDC